MAFDLAQAQVVVVPRPWDHPDPESDKQQIGPIDIPWSIRTFFFDIGEGAFRVTVQNFIIEKKTYKLVVKGYRDKHIMASGNSAMHDSGAPVVGQDVVEAVHAFAGANDITLADAYLAHCIATDTKLHPNFIEQVKKAPKRYTQETADKLRAKLGTETDDEQIRRLEVELELRKKAQAAKTPAQSQRRRVGG